VINATRKITMFLVMGLSIDRQWPKKAIPEMPFVAALPLGDDWFSSVSSLGKVKRRRR